MYPIASTRRRGTAEWRISSARWEARSDVRLVPLVYATACNWTEPDAPDIALAVISTESNRIVVVPGADAGHVAAMWSVGWLYCRRDKMGYTVLIQWSCPATSRPAPLVDLILNRVLEHYNISRPARSSIQIRTYRAALPSSSASGKGEISSGSVSRTLSTVVYSQTFSSPEETQVANLPRDDTAYVFIEDGKNREGGSASGQTETVSAPPQSQPAVEESKLEAEGFEIVDAAKAVDQPAPQADGEDRKAMDVDGEVTSASPPRHRIIALRPAASVLPLLQNLLSPFVMGLTKAARASASLIAETPRPTPLPGSNLPLLSFTFPPLPQPSPPLVLTIHNLPSSTASTIFLEAEWSGEGGSAAAKPVLCEFLEGCLPEGITGEKRFWSNDGADGLPSWEGIERMKNLTEMLVQALREGSHV